MKDYFSLFFWLLNILVHSESRNKKRIAQTYTLLVQGSWVTESSTHEGVHFKLAVEMISAHETFSFSQFYRNLLPVLHNLTQ